MTPLKLIAERIEHAEVILEGVDGEKFLHIKGPFLQFAVKNKNGRFYPDYCHGEVERYINEKVNIKTAYGELGHPAGPTINPERISHLIKSLTRKGNDWFGDAVVIDEGYGKVVHAVHKIGGQLGVSSRALGSLKEQNGVMMVQEDFRLSTAADIVTDPSAPSAYVNGIMENAEWVYDGFGWKQHELIESHKRQFKRETLQQIEEHTLGRFRTFLRSISR